jgi:hypothetical protein
MKISTLLFICALALSAVAAYYSIVGLAAIFSAAFWPVVIMAGILEVSKLVCASWLYQKWNEINNLIKTYLTLSVVILMIITSLGIFGFLTRAHVDQQLGNTEVSLKIDQIDNQIKLSKETVDRYKTQLAQLDRAINIQLDANRASQALAARQRQVAERDQIRQRLDSEQEKLTSFETSKSELKQKISVLESEVGPIKYVAEFFSSGNKVDVEKAVRWMIVILVCVFDPLAVLMLIAANMTLIKERKKDEAAQLPQSFISTPPIAVSKEPTDHLAGDIKLKYDFKQKSLMYFDGNTWIPTELGLLRTENDITSEHADVEKQILHSVEKIIDEKNKQNLADIQNTVKLAMDSWLTAASTSQHAKQDVQQNTSSVEPTNTVDNISITDITVKVEQPSNDLPTLQKATNEIINKPPSWI